MLKASFWVLLLGRLFPDLLAGLAGCLLVVLLGCLLLALLALLPAIFGFKGGLWAVLLLGAVWVGYRS